jgi:molybdopterin-guanine dinucleotide biosynthesis protein A
MIENTPSSYVVVQAGGKGTRLEQFTWNKPKCLAPVDGKPLLYHIFDAFPGAHFLIILDFKKDIVIRFLDAFPPEVSYEIVEMDGVAGNLAGISEAVRRVPDGIPVSIVWCDLKFDSPVVLPDSPDVLVATTQKFRCRWSFDETNRLVERASQSTGVIGLFRFPDREFLTGIPSTGEFVEWLSKAGFPLCREEVNDVKEIGTIDALLDQWALGGHARFFNHVEISDRKIVKRARFEQYQNLIDGEVSWYEEADRLGFSNCPRLLEKTPLSLERISGRHAFEFAVGTRGKIRILQRMMEMLGRLHRLKKAPGSQDVLREVYLEKTMQRLEPLKKLLPSVTEQSFFRINGRLCRNILHRDHVADFASRVSAIEAEEFCFIHGDPTFSNIIIDDAGEPWLIDPRASFGSAWLVGDPRYDWAKLYYSAVGDYDNFNRRQFLLEVDGTEVSIQIRSGGWSHLQGVFREFCGGTFADIEVLHSLIWLSLSGYVRDDYDSILASFFNGLLLFERTFDKEISSVV